MPFAQFDYPSLSYMVLALTSAVTTLPNIALIFHDFPGPNVFLNIFKTLTNNKDATKPAYPITVVYIIAPLNFTSRWSEAPNGNIVQNDLNIALLNYFST